VKRFIKYFIFFLLSGLAVYLLFFRQRYPVYVIMHSLKAGDSLDSFNGVTVYSNGADYEKSYGRHYSADSSCYYGKK
jgi:hypothetical protein